MPITFTGIQRVTHDQDRLREAEFWASRSMAERVIAGWALAENNLLPREHESLRSEQVSLFAAFLAAGVEYAVAVAVNAHGFGRNTRDPGSVHSAQHREGAGGLPRFRSSRRVPLSSQKR